MKKLFPFLICVLLMFVLTSCVSSSNTDTDSTTNTESEDVSSSDSNALTIGDTGELNGISFTVNSGQLMDTGVVDDPHYNPPEGRKDLLLNITITNNSDSGYEPYLGEFWIISKNTEFNSTNIGQDDDITIGGMKTIAPGESATGTVSFQVPADADDYELFCSTEMAVDKDSVESIEFNLKPDQLS